MGVPNDSSSDSDMYVCREAVTRESQSKRLAKKAGAAVFASGLLLAAVVVVRRQQGGDVAAGVGQGVTLLETVKVRGAHEHCTKKGDCSETNCCAVTNMYCWRTDTGGAECAEYSKPEWPGYEVEGPSTHVPVDKSQEGSSLFCFSVYRENKGTNDLDNEALRLLQGQLGYGVGVFACDMWRVYSDVEGKLNDEHSLIKVEEEDGDSFYQSKRPQKGGWGGGQWINTPLFRQVWHKIYSEYPGGYNTMAWVVKADPDTVFVPARLSARLASQGVPFPGLYIEHCSGVDYGFFGSLEVISKKGATTLFENMDSCYETLPWKTDKMAQKYGWYGEDLFAQRCMDKHGVEKIWQFELVADGTCPEGRPYGKKDEIKWVPDPTTCGARDTFVAFKPLKAPEDFSACLKAINPAVDYQI